MRLRRRETVDTLTVQMIELETERAGLQAYLYGLLQTGTGTELHRGLDDASKVSKRIDGLRQELNRAEVRSLPVEELI
ncbi:MAG: hypothetical protein DLM67_14445 [Candidatus Nephthysia bennettiae]|nr:MAG: hypothetical protein DLM67_14445 [Candidatus Dormibacteraeota bacterium]